jgi:hypothetical protein
MSSEAESFLGLESGSSPIGPRAPVPFVRRRLTWLLLIVVGYLSSFLWLGAFVVMVPVLIASAPFGLLSIFAPTLDPHSPHGQQLTGIIHAIFWPLYLLGLVGSPFLNIHFLRTLFIIVTVVVLLTMYGCAAHYHINPGDLH